MTEKTTGTGDFKAISAAFDEIGRSFQEFGRVARMAISEISAPVTAFGTQVSSAVARHVETAAGASHEPPPD